MTENHNGWNIWQKHVLSELGDLKESAEKQSEITTNLLIGMAELRTQFKMKSGFWGLLGGAITVLLTISIYLIKGMI